MRTAHVLIRFCHRVDRSFGCKTKEGRHVRIIDISPLRICSIKFSNFNVNFWKEFFFIQKCRLMTNKEFTVRRQDINIQIIRLTLQYILYKNVKKRK